MSSVDFDEVADLFLDLQIQLSPTGLQGWLTGFLSSGARLQPEQWLDASLAYLDPSKDPDSEDKAELVTFYDFVLDGLQDENMAYGLFIPDDVELEQQVECLAQWAKGFLDGFGYAGRQKDKDLSQEVKEVLSHFDAFSDGELDADASDADNATLLRELCDHARVTALFVFYEFNRASENDETTAPSLH
jgi:uncharacterized protein YgfB (UPF0149 family)